MKRKAETGKYVRMLTSEIRSTLNRHTILKTTLVELAQTLKLNNCNIWMPSEDGESYKLTHELEEKTVTSAVPHTTVPRTDSGVQYVKILCSESISCSIGMFEILGSECILGVLNVFWEC